MARMTVSKTVDLSSTLSFPVYTTGLLKSVLSYVIMSLKKSRKDDHHEKHSICILIFV